MLTTTEDQGAVRILRFNRPHALNAFNPAMVDAVAEDLLAAADNDAIKVLIVTGEGRAFSAGMDLADNGAKANLPVHGFDGMFEAFIEFPKPILLAINGVGVGFGCTITGLADLVFMARSARLRCPFTALGLTAEAASTVTFAAMMGPQVANWVLLSSEWLDAQTCKDYGMVFEVVEDELLLQRTVERAQVLASKPLASLITTKEMLMAPRREALREASEIESVGLHSLMGGPANLEALAAFAERREPDFSAF
ncbi:MAG: enoyl-CoA hydratase/isomerase family protein [Proteobacteria bacterium]|nr:enoyl-CoA hydratase/isomerase family protein [Pseudomonadota bacterium]